MVYETENKKNFFLKRNKIANLNLFGETKFTNRFYNFINRVSIFIYL